MAYVIRDFARALVLVLAFLIVVAEVQRMDDEPTAERTAP